MTGSCQRLGSKVLHPLVNHLVKLVTFPLHGCHHPSLFIHLSNKVCQITFISLLYSTSLHIQARPLKILIKFLTATRDVPSSQDGNKEPSDPPEKDDR